MEDKNKDNTEEKIKLYKRINWLFTSIFTIVIASWVVYLFIMKAIKSNIDVGKFGDMFGALNTLFTGLAFGGVAYSIYQQKKSLNNQQKEIELYQIELKNNNEHLYLQRVENTLINIINFHLNLLGGRSSFLRDEFVHNYNHFVGILKYIDSRSISDKDKLDCINILELHLAVPITQMYYGEAKKNKNLGEDYLKVFDLFSKYKVAIDE